MAKVQLTMCVMSILEVTCPVCDEVLELSDADRAELLDFVKTQRAARG